MKIKRKVIKIVQDGKVGFLTGGGPFNRLTENPLEAKDFSIDSYQNTIKLENALYMLNLPFDDAECHFDRGLTVESAEVVEVEVDISYTVVASFGSRHARKADPKN